MFPPTRVFLPLLLRISPTRVVVVVFPLEPVIALTLFGLETVYGVNRVEGRWLKAEDANVHKGTAYDRQGGTSVAWLELYRDVVVFAFAHGLEAEGSDALRKVLASDDGGAAIEMPRSSSTEISLCNWASDLVSETETRAPWS